MAGLPTNTTSKARLGMRLLMGLLLAIAGAQVGGFAMSEIPISAPKDGVMAKPAEVRRMRDWVDASFEDAKAAEGGLLLAAAKPPFSFTYGGEGSGKLLAGWKHGVERREEKDRTRISSHWTDPKTGLRVTAEVIAYKQYPAVDWVLYFENTGAKDTPIIEDVNALDVGLATGDAAKTAVLHRLHGDACGAQSFEPYNTDLRPGQSINMAPAGGRSSNTTAFPWFNFEYDGQGLIAAIGWSGQWKAAFERSDSSPTRFTAGMEQTHLLLHPGERIRSPRIVLMHWAGNRMDAHNRFRRLVLFNYCPKIEGRPVQLPVALQNFDRYMRKPGWATEEGQVASAKAAAEMGCDTYWFDAGWFPGDFPRGVGNWFCKPNEFPNGLKPLGVACHSAGLKFVLWFEPERVADGTHIAREHPEFCLGTGGDRLFNLGNPEARRWLTDLLSARISEYGVDVYRNDFNIDPLGFWRANDAPDRQGMTEIRYVEGHYAMWDELRARHPGLWIDNCASGGRRIDIETCIRSVPLWRSDTCCSAGHTAWDQAQNCAIAQYVPLFTGASWSPDAYTARSMATAGTVCEWGFMDDRFSMALAKQSVKEAKATRKYWYGDIYPLTPVTIGLDQMMAWQLHRSDLDEGMVLAFRREDSPYLSIAPKLKGLDPKKSYEVRFIDDARKTTVRTISGKELGAGLELKLPKKGSSLLVIYKAVVRD